MWTRGRIRLVGFKRDEHVIRSLLNDDMYTHCSFRLPFTSGSAIMTSLLLLFLDFESGLVQHECFVTTEKLFGSVIVYFEIVFKKIRPKFVHTKM